MSRSAGSKPCASTPARWSASSTARPDMSEISRSAERPPSSTATFPKSWAFISQRLACGCRSLATPDSPASVLRALPLLSWPVASSCLTDDANLALEEHAEALVHRALDLGDELLDLQRRGGSGVDDEVGVLGRNHRPAHRDALQPACLDQACGIIASRVAEHRPGVRLLERLAGDAPLQ